MKTIQLRALIFQEAGLWCAQCLERDIAVQASTPEELIDVLGDTLRCYVETALEDDREPFADLPRAPAHFEEMYAQARDYNDNAPIRVLDAGEAPQIVPTFRVLQHV